MNIRPIETEHDYDLVLEEIESLLGAPMGSEASDRLEALVTLVRAYESKNHPIEPPAQAEVALEDEIFGLAEAAVWRAAREKAAARREQDAESEEALAELTAQAQELKMGY